VKSGAANERVVVRHPIPDPILEEVRAQSNGDSRSDHPRVDGIMIVQIRSARDALGAVS